MENAELMQKEIENKRKMPKELKQEVFKNIFQNLLIAVIIMAYLCTINILFYKLQDADFEKYMKYFALGTIFTTVIGFEIAYRRESKRIMIIGIELLLCSIFSLYVPYIYLLSDQSLRKITIIVPIAIAIYYIIKAFLMYKNKEFHYHNNLSDVKEILKDTEKTSYIDEESFKTFRKNKQIEEEIKEELLEEQRNRKEKNKKNKTVKSKNETKKTNKRKNVTKK